MFLVILNDFTRGFLWKKEEKVKIVRLKMAKNIGEFKIKLTRSAN